MLLGIITTFLLAMTPFGELRLSLPVALTVYHLHWLVAYFVSVIGNLIPVIFFLLFLEPISVWLSKHFKIFKWLFDWLFRISRDRNQEKIKKYGYPFLTILAAIPLPLAGAWTAVLLAFLFKVPRLKAFFLIALGVMIAGAIVLGGVMAGLNLEKYFGWPALMGLVAAIGLGWLIYRIIKSQGRNNQ